MTTNDTSSPSANGITGRIGRAVAGLRRSGHARSSAGISMSYTRPRFQWGVRAEIQFVLWETKVRVKHLFGRHTLVDLEQWVDGEKTVIGGLCWLCPERG